MSLIILSCPICAHARKFFSFHIPFRFQTLCDFLHVKLFNLHRKSLADTMSSTVQRGELGEAGDIRDVPQVRGGAGIHTQGLFIPRLCVILLPDQLPIFHLPSTFTLSPWQTPQKPRALGTLEESRVSAISRALQPFCSVGCFSVSVVQFFLSFQIPCRQGHGGGDVCFCEAAVSQPRRTPGLRRG